MICHMLHQIDWATSSIVSESIQNPCHIILTVYFVAFPHLFISIIHKGYRPWCVKICSVNIGWQIKDITIIISLLYLYLLLYLLLYISIRNMISNHSTIVVGNCQYEHSFGSQWNVWNVWRHSLPRWYK